MYLHNRLVQPDALTIAGESIDLSAIRVPSFFLSARQDHIAKWKTTYRGAGVYGGDVRFVLSGSGHIAGVINPPYKENTGTGPITNCQARRMTGLIAQNITLDPGGHTGVNGW